MSWVNHPLISGANKVKDKEKTKQQLINELAELRQRISDLGKQSGFWLAKSAIPGISGGLMSHEHLSKIEKYEIRENYEV